MSIASGVRISPHFTAAELGADRPEATGAIVTQLYKLAVFLEVVRGLLTVPLVVNDRMHKNRGFRPRDSNATVGGSATSSHQTGEAADVVPQGFAGTMRDAYDTVLSANNRGMLPPFDQIIYYPVQGHIHIGLGPKLRGESRVYLFEGAGGIPLVSAGNIQALGGIVASTIVAAVAAFSVANLIMIIALAYVALVIVGELN